MATKFLHCRFDIFWFSVWNCLYVTLNGVEIFEGAPTFFHNFCTLSLDCMILNYSVTDD